MEENNIILVDNSEAPVDEFRDLMQTTDLLLNHDASTRENYYISRNGKALEEDVEFMLNKAAIGTSFEGAIQLVSGSKFPDIIANRLYGVEVKSTKKNHWTSTGSSILEHTRVDDVERIFLTFGKLGRPVQFRSRPYEECMSDIAVTHYPRYKINMELGAGQTIFDKIGIPYEELRKMDNPTVPVSDYYRSRLKPGESLWWVGDNADAEVSMVVRIWSVISGVEKIELMSEGLALFPEIVYQSNNSKYNRFVLWLATNKSIVNPSVRDTFSAGGREVMKLPSGIEVPVPQIFKRIGDCAQPIRKYIETTDAKVLREQWGVSRLLSNRVRQWCGMITEIKVKGMDKDILWQVMLTIFPDIGTKAPARY